MIYLQIFISKSINLSTANRYVETGTDFKAM